MKRDHILGSWLPSQIAWKSKSLHLVRFRRIVLHELTANAAH